VHIKLFKQRESLTAVHRIGGVPRRSVYRWLPVVAVVVAALLLALLLGRAAGPPTREEVLAVATFPSVAEDLNLILCDGKALSLVPPGVDPHDYQLSPGDVEKLKAVRVIVSTGHTPFELRIRDLVERGELTAVLVEIPKIPGMRILANPATGQPNLHMPIYDPGNYEVFARYLAEKLSEVDPAHAACYAQKLQQLLSELDSIKLRARAFNVTALATRPPAQYAVWWAGVRVGYLLVKEEGLPATSEDMARIERALAAGEIKLIVALSDDPAPLRSKAEELSARYNVPLIIISSPTTPPSIYEKIAQVAQELSKIATST
jgi:zinc/manganese transport system substrate-binding protein